MLVPQSVRILRKFKVAPRIKVYSSLTYKAGSVALLSRLFLFLHLISFVMLRCSSLATSTYKKYAVACQLRCALPNLLLKRKKLGEVLLFLSGLFLFLHLISFVMLRCSSLATSTYKKYAVACQLRCALPNLLLECKGNAKLENLKRGFNTLWNLTE